MIHETKIIPRYAETDQMGIIHHSVYAIWYEQARTEYFEEIGINYAKIEKEDGLITPIVELNCKYKKPAFYNEEVIVKTKLIEVSPVKFSLEYSIYNLKNEIINIGITTLVWADSENMKIVNLKKVKPDLYKKMVSLVK